ncbi:hypothetical protein KIN20_010376 [Parelaphostrongylus tenuis]|uniref:Uncharacterized protein n=1 Tax=Parelaphostrongylus tenuis TaxID=148309 RepID=A0AAD5MTB0_PARTN|nr:hypothetical protein KIN20_010376 [Parelaphostrongylus tenuis]
MPVGQGVLGPLKSPASQLCPLPWLTLLHSKFVPKFLALAADMGGAQAFVSRLVMRANIAADMMNDKCNIARNTVTGICKMKAPELCTMGINISAISPQHLTISRSILTTNIIMANWSRTMWQGVVNRALRMLASGPFGSHFFAASADVGGS